METQFAAVSKYYDVYKTISPVSAQPSKYTAILRQTPTISQARRYSSRYEVKLDLPTYLEEAAHSLKSETVLYLAYGSNLSAETFLGKRNIKPIAQTNVVVPSLILTFDLRGIPYTEPCFGNVRYRESPSGEKQSQSVGSQDYHKDRWTKGMVGVVYEVTNLDFAHIIATEGGGAGYQDVLIDCYELDADPNQSVPDVPTGEPFKAHTLFAPSTVSKDRRSYAQPSPRYLKLIRDGAKEHNLAVEYQNYLEQIRTYHITTASQRLGSYVFLMLWGPIFAFIFQGGAALFIGKDGRYPPWFAAMTRALFTGCWASYDKFFKKTFGDGERTIGDGPSLVNNTVSDEKAFLKSKHRQLLYGTAKSESNIV